MKQKRLQLLLALLITAATGAWAQQTLTVYDGTFYDNYSPANICYIDQYTRSQTVIPSTALTAMKGCDITAMKFYSNSYAASGPIDYSFDVYLKEVSYTAFAETSPTFEPKSSCTSVHQGKLSISNHELTITFSKPFHYNGGNLLLGMENNSKVTYYDITFVGRDTGSSLSNISIHHADDLALATIKKRYFIPKTTFTYVVPTYSVKLADGTKDAANWTIASGENSATGDAADGLTGLKEGDAVTLTYGGRLKVKNVTATTDAAPAANIVDLSTISGDNYTVTGDVILTGTPTESEFYIKYGGDDYEVTLDNVNSAGYKQVLVDGDRHNINIKLKGTSRLKEIYTGDMNNNTVTIGEAAAGGTLILTGSTDPIRGKTLTINGGTVKSQATGDNWAVYLNNSVGVLTINGGALYLAAGEDGTKAVKGTVSGSVTLYGWDGSAWVTYTDQRYATTDNTSGNPTGWTW